VAQWRIALTEVIVERVDESFIKIDAPSSILMELRDRFSYDLPKAEYLKRRNKKYRYWDGKLRIFKLRSRTIYAGLVHKVAEFCKERGYEFIDRSGVFVETPVSVQAARDVMATVVPSLEGRDYQWETVAHCLSVRRAVIVSPTSSGKSAIIYTLTRHLNLRTLIIVPTTGLVLQMAKEFNNYATDWGTFKDDISIVMEGYSKVDLNRVVIGTWQSIFRLPHEWFDRFDVVIIDEAHLAKAASLVSLMEKCVNANWRFGFTGTLDGLEINEMVLEGLFGPPRAIIKTRELIEREFISTIEIRCMIFSHTPTDRRAMVGASYQDEINFIVGCDARNEYIKDLAMALPGNTLILFQYVEKHGKIIYDKLRAAGAKTFFVDGSVSAEEREIIRATMERETGWILVASFGTTSTGWNLVNLNNIIFSSPTKSKIRTLQSIGRGLRRGGEKDHFTLFDVADDLSTQGHKNHTILHFSERLKNYIDEGFPYKIHIVTRRTK